MKQKIEFWSNEKLDRRTFLSFGVFGLAGLVGIFTWRWFRNLAQDENGLSGFSRDVLKFNERVNEKLFSETNLAPTYSKELAVSDPKVNGDIGMEYSLRQEDWQLEIQSPSQNELLYLKLDAIKSLKKQELIVELKCIEGWSEIVNYAGVSFADFLKYYKLGINEVTQTLYKYVGLETPDGAYYVGIDMKSMMHSQTLLCYELNGESLSEAHGAPLRLLIPIKYGVKNLKRIGKIFFSDEPPRDYWHENGYDYDCAL